MLNVNSYSDLFINTTIKHDAQDLVETKSVNNSDSLTYTLDSGIYYLQAYEKDGQSAGPGTFLVVNKTGLLFRQDDREILLSSFDLMSSSAISDPMTIYFYKTQEQPTIIKEIPMQGIERISYAYPDDVDIILAKRGDEWIFVPVSIPMSQADLEVTKNLDTTYKIFLYTDRPIYKPTDTVQYRGIVRQDKDALYAIPPAGTKVRVYLGGEEKINQFVTTDEHGSFWGFINLSSLSKTQSGQSQNSWDTIHSLYASADLAKKTGEWDPTAVSTYFDIVSYVKPEFDLKTEVTKAEYLRNEPLVFTIKGTYFNGKPLANREIKYSVYKQPFYEIERAVYNKNFNISSFGRGMCGGGFSQFEEYFGESMGNYSGHPVTLDTNGIATVTLPPNLGSTSQQYTLVASTQDQSNNQIVSASTTTVHGGSINMFLLPSGEQYSFGDSITVPFYAEELNGTKFANKTVQWRLVTYRSVTDPDTYVQKSEENSVANGQVTTDDQGKGIVITTTPMDFMNTSATMVLTTSDVYNNAIEVKKPLTFKKKDEEKSTYNYWEQSNLSQTYLKIRSNNNSYKVGDTITLTIESPTTLDALLTLERGRVYAPQVVHLVAGVNTVNIEVTSELSPSVSVVLSFFADGAYHTEGLSLNVPAMHKLLTIEVSSDKPHYSPNETAIITVTTKDASNTPVSARLSLAVVDKAIFALRKNAPPPIHSTLYAYRPRSTNASSSLTFVASYFMGGRGGGGGGGGSLNGKLVDTLYWNPDLTTDEHGQISVEVPLAGITTTWKILSFGTTLATDVGQGDTEFIAAN